MLENSSPVPAKEIKTNITQKNSKNKNQEKESESSSPVPANNLTFAQNQQEPLANSLSNDDNKANTIPRQNLLIPAQTQQESSANSLSNKATSVNQRKSSPYVLSDDEEDSDSSIVILSNNNSSRRIQPSQHSLQELFQKKPEGGIQRKIDDIAIEVDLQPKLPTQFQNMSNEFEIAYWLAHNKSVLNLAVNIQNGLTDKIRTDEKYETASTSTTLQHYNVLSRQLPFESAPPEITQVVILIFSQINIMLYVN